jgi:hypothetical protein
MLLYLGAVLVFFSFFIGAGVWALACAISPSLRASLPLAWRVWAGGTFGFLSAYLLSSLLLRMVPAAIRHTSGRQHTASEAGFMLSVLVYLPPAIALIGGLVGAGVGYLNGIRRSRASSIP